MSQLMLPSQNPDELLCPLHTQDGSLWNEKVPLCSTVAPLGAPSGPCYTSMQGAALAYANVPYWLAQQASCWNPASCKCTGGVPGKRVLRFVDGNLLDAPCGSANKMGTQPKCQVGTGAESWLYKGQASMHTKQTS